MLKKLFSIDFSRFNKLIIYFLGIKLTLPFIRHKNILSRKQWIKFITLVNGSPFADKGHSLYYLRNKTIFLNRFKKHLKREFLVINENNFKEFENFVKKHQKFIAKVIDGGGGEGIYVYNLKNNENLKNIFQELNDNKAFLLEEFIKQEKSIEEIYPYSVTTIRICTLNINNNIEIISIPELRIGSDKEEINSRKLFITEINPDTGITEGISFSNFNYKIYKNNIHPDTNKSVKNFQIPYWEEVKQLAIQAASFIPEISYVGWDIALSENGPVVIEGNGGSQSYNDEQFLSCQKTGSGVRQYYENLSNYIKFKKTLTPEKISQINNLLFIDENTNIKNIDYALILGSKKGLYRAKQAFEKFKKFKNITYIVSGTKNETKNMKNILLENGCSNDKIIEENESKNTFDNITKSFKLLKQFPKEVKTPTIVIITAGFHSKRVENIVKKFKLEEKYNILISSAYGQQTKKENWYKTFYGANIINQELKKVLISKKDIKELCF